MTGSKIFFGVSNTNQEGVITERTGCIPKQPKENGIYETTVFKR